MHLGPFGCLTEFGAKRAELGQKFVPRSRVGIFHNQCTRSTPLDPKLTFWSVSYYLVHSGSFACLTKLGAERAELMQKFVPRSRVGFFRNEGTQSTPCDPKLTFGAFLLFGCIQDCLVALRNSMQNGPNKFKSSCHEVASEFFATKAPDPPHWTLN